MERLTGDSLLITVVGFVTLSWVALTTLREHRRETVAVGLGAAATGSFGRGHVGRFAGGHTADGTT